MVRKRRGVLVGAGLAVLVLASFAAYLAYQWQMPRVRDRIVAILSEELGSTVELADVQVSLGRTVRVTATGLVVRHRRYQDVPPLVRVERFTVEAPLMALARTPIHLSSVEVTGLRIFVPLRRDGDTAPRGPSSLTFSGPSPVVVDRLTADGAVLEIGLRRADRPPRTFLIRHVLLTAAAFDRPSIFEAELTNPKPTGVIVARGTFGPWQAGEPSLTPLNGTYTFSNADLGTIHGIGGRLDSSGAFSGRLEQIIVKGTTRTPDFTLDIGGEALPLDTEFTAIVDGTSGDTVLDSVRATLGSTPMTARGGIVHKPGQKGRTVELDVTIDQGRIEDVLRLALKDEPPDMSGGLRLKAHLELPPGPSHVPLRLKLKGDFHVASARFASRTVQSRIDELSRRGRGMPTDQAVANVASDLQGAFSLGGGVLTLSRVSFAVRGATIRLAGNYSLTHRTLDFSGTARLEARASQMVTGWKRFPLKIFDPLLAKDGAGTVLPIRISGPASHPDFKVEVKKIF